MVQVVLYVDLLVIPKGVVLNPILLSKRQNQRSCITCSRSSDRSVVVERLESRTG